MAGQRAAGEPFGLEAGQIKNEAPSVHHQQVLRGLNLVGLQEAHHVPNVALHGVSSQIALHHQIVDVLVDELIHS